MLMSLSDNDVEKFINSAPFGFFNPRNIQKLDLYDMKTLPNLSNLQGLKYLCIHQVENVDYDAIFSELPHLRELLVNESQGISHAPNVIACSNSLEKLDIPLADIDVTIRTPRQVTCLSNFESLEELNIHGLPDIYLSSFACYSTLTKLSIELCVNSHNLSLLKRMTSLRELALYGFRSSRYGNSWSNWREIGIIDLGFLKSLLSLTLLELCNFEQMINVGCLSLLGELRQLTINNCCNFAALPVLGCTETLEECTIAYCPSLSDFSAVSTLTRLKRLSIKTYDNIQYAIPDLAAKDFIETIIGRIDISSNLNSLVNLKTLEISYCGPTLSPFSCGNTLTSLNLKGYGNDRLKDISSISELTALKHLLLQLRGSHVTDFSCFSFLANLETLYIDGSYFVEILPPLQSALKQVHLSFSRFKDISSLSVLDHLQLVELKACNIEKIPEMACIRQQTLSTLDYL